MSLNKVYLIGRLTRDPDLRYTQGGVAVCEIGMAVNRRYTVNGEDREETCFVDVTVWGKMGENTKRYLEKGSQAMVEGRLQFDQWEDRETEARRSKLRVVAENIQFLGGGSGGGGRRDEGGDTGYYDQSQGQQYSGGGSGGGQQQYEARPYGGHGGGQQQNRPQGGQAPPPMPTEAFDPGTDAEEDIPF